MTGHFRCTAGVLLLLCLLGGCGASGPATTRFSLSDIDYSSEELTAQLGSSGFLSQRGPGSPPVRLMPGEFRNISNERIGLADRWMIASRMLYEPGVLELLRSKNVDVVMPPSAERVFRTYALAEAVAVERETPEGGIERVAPEVRYASASAAPTHLLDMLFLSASRSTADGDERKDLFVVQAEIVEFETGRVVWSGSDEFARVARGLILD